MATKKTTAKAAADKKPAKKAAKKTAKKAEPKKAAAPKAAKPKTVEIPHDEIAMRAAELHMANPYNTDVENWLLAEKQLRAERS